MVQMTKKIGPDGAGVQNLAGGEVYWAQLFLLLTKTKLSVFQGVMVDKTLYISGQLGLNTSGEMVRILNGNDHHLEHHPDEPLSS